MFKINISYYNKKSFLGAFDDFCLEKSNSMPR